MSFSTELSDALEGVDMGMNDDGEISLSLVEPQTVSEENGTSASDEGPSDGDAPTAQKPAPTPSRPDPEVAQLKAQLAQMQQKIDAASQRQDDDSELEFKLPEDTDLVSLLSDNEKGLQLLRDLVRLESKRELKQFEAMNNEYKSRLEINRALQTYGQDFVDRIAYVDAVVKQYPQATVEEAYQTVLAYERQHGGLPGMETQQNEAQSSAGEADDRSRKEPEPDVQELAERARKLQTETGVAAQDNNDPEPGNAKTVSQALRMALAEMSEG